MHHGFTKEGTTGSAVHDESKSNGPVTRATTASDDDWLLDEAAFTMETTDRRRLSRVPIEHLMVSPIGTMLLLLVRASTDMEVMKGRGEKVDDVQKLPRSNISSREYYTLQCSISQSNYRDDLI
jgi:hypothetical protein